MNYMALATDYDGTLATEGRVDAETLAALQRLRESGRRIILVTGRELEDLATVFDRLDLFDLVVAENGALVLTPATGELLAVGAPPPPAFVAALRERGVGPISVGHVIVATWEPHEQTVLAVIREFGLEHQIIFNKGAVMILPPGVNKATGLMKALEAIGLVPANIASVGDAENDHSFLAVSGCAVAVANALPMLKQSAHIVTEGARGAGVAELIDRLIATDLSEVDEANPRHRVALGDRPDGQPFELPTRNANVLLAGDSGGGKSTLTIGTLERLIERGLQCCVIDPEGDYDQFDGAVVIGDAEQPVDPDEVLELLDKNPGQSLIVNLLATPLASRPALLADLMPKIQHLQLRTARPHWLIVDEAHHMLPAAAGSPASLVPGDFKGLFLVTVHPEHVAPAILAGTDCVLVTGKLRDRVLNEFCRVVDCAVPDLAGMPPAEPGQIVAWAPRSGQGPVPFTAVRPRGLHQRHIRKYAEGRLPEERSFYFHGVDGRLNLRAHNLMIFCQMAEGVDEETWAFHLHRGDYSRWFRDAIKDEDLAAETAALEGRTDLPPGESRELVLAAINRRYTGSPKEG